MTISMKPLLLALDANTALRDAMLASDQFENGACIVRQFPDGESYVRILSECAQRDVVILCSLHQPDSVIMPLLFCAETLRELGAKSVGLIAPYLAYMRQDMRFHTGEAVNAKIFAQLISAHFDWLVTVDPHLHRIHDLAEIYSIPQRTLTAVPLLAQWLEREIKQPLLIGPDSESEQWVANIAKLAHAPYIILEKTRRGDRDVEIALPDLQRWRGHTPVLIDDIISTGHTMLEVIAQLRAEKLPAPICSAVHGVFAEGADQKLLAAGARRVVTSNSISHTGNVLDITPLVVTASLALLSGRAPPKSP